MQFEINMMGNMTGCDFYIPDAKDTTGLAFRLAYYKATSYEKDNNKELCAYVGSMLCSVVPAFKNSVEAALNGIGVTPHFVSLPSQAQENKIVISKAPELDLDWSSILVVFGYCVLILFKMDNNELFNFNIGSTKNPNRNRIVELRTKIGCSVSNSLDIPFNQQTEKEIRTMLGTKALRNSVITFLTNNFNHFDPQICSLCHYLSYTLSWSGDMRIFTVMNERLVKAKSPVLSDSRVAVEVDHLEELYKAIASHSYPQYFNHLGLTSELFYLDVSRFPNLFGVALVLEKGGDILDCYRSELIKGVNRKTVEELVKLETTSLTQNRVSTGRRFCEISGV